jgi:hypothetical protein
VSGAQLIALRAASVRTRAASSCGDWNPLTEVAYSEIEDIEIGGPGLVKSGGGFIGGGFGAMGALEGMALASVLNALTTKTRITTIIRVQAAACELFLLWTQAPPEQLRIELSQPLGAIRAARAAAVHSPASRHLQSQSCRRRLSCFRRVCSPGRSLTS